MTGLTRTQAKVLRYLGNFIAANGYPPTVAETANNFGWRSPNAASDVLLGLQRKGFIRRERYIARGITILRAQE